MPKIFLTDKFIPFNLKRVVIISDLSIMENAFKNPAISSRVLSEKMKLGFHLDELDFNIPELRKSLKLKTISTKTNSIGRLMILI